MPLSDLSLVADMDCLKGPAGRKVGTKARQNSPERGMRRNKCGLEAKGTALRPASSHGNGHFRAKIVTRLRSLSGIGHSCLPRRHSCRRLYPVANFLTRRRPCLTTPSVSAGKTNLFLMELS